MKFKPVQAFEQVGTHLSGWRSFASTANSGIELGYICILHSIWLRYSYSMSFFQAFETSSTEEKIKRQSTGFHLKCSPKCLILPCMHLDSPIIHLCVFSERQTVKSFWCHVRFLASPLWPCLRERGREDMEVERDVSRDKPESRAVFTQECISLVCKALSRALQSPSMMHTDVLKYSAIEFCIFRPGQSSLNTTFSPVSFLL